MTLCAAAAALAAESDAAPWSAARRIAEAHDIAYVSAAVRGDACAVAWEVPQGIMWRVSADGGRTFSGGDLMGNHFRPRLEYLQDGALGLVMLQKGPRGAEAAFTRIAADGRASEKSVRETQAWYTQTRVLQTQRVRPIHEQAP